MQTFNQNEWAFLHSELMGAMAELAPTAEDEIKKLQKDFTDSWKDLKGLLDQQTDEIRSFGETNQKTADTITAVEKKLANFDAEIKGFNSKLTELETKANRPFIQGGGTTFKSVGESFVESEAYKRMIASGTFNSDGMEVKSLFKPQATKDLDSTPTGGGVIPIPARVPEIIMPPNRLLRIRDLMNVTETTTNAIDFIQETGYTNASAPVAEKALKPQSNITFDIVTAGVKTIAHWIPATRQIVADVPMLRNYVDNRLIYGLKLTEENQLLFGSGVGENLQGLMTATGVQDMGALPAGVTLIDRVRQAITRAIIANYPVTGIVLHPTDWETIQLTKSTQGEYIWVSVTAGGEERLWAVPVIQSVSMPVGSFLVGAFGLGAQIWDREQANVRISEHHADYFARNMIAVLCEERIAMTIYRPEAFVKGLFTA